jgi:chondroitin 4-sulfotransferase 11
MHLQYLDNPCFISHEKKFIYLPIQKAACSSLKLTLAPYFGIDVHISDNARDNAMLDLNSFEHLHAQDFPRIPKIEIFNERYCGYFKFAFVRNPFDRLASFYNNKIQKEPLNNKFYVDGIPTFLTRDYGKGLFKSGMPFEDFVRLVCSTPDKACEMHFRPQYLFLEHDGTAFPLDFLGKVENMKEDFEYVADELGIDHRLEYINSTNRGADYKNYYTQELKEIVKKKYERDMRRFCYSF